nr:MAG TPA: hypothetical protein [Caudoviricetes sp.]
MQKLSFNNATQAPLDAGLFSWYNDEVTNKERTLNHVKEKSQ